MKTRLAYLLYGALLATAAFGLRDFAALLADMRATTATVAAQNVLLAGEINKIETWIEAQQ